MSSMDDMQIGAGTPLKFPIITKEEVARVYSDDAFYRPATRPRAGKGTFVVGVCGAARSGKNTVAEHLVRMYGPRHCGGGMDVRAYALADSLKAEVYDWLEGFWGGTTPEFIPSSTYVHPGMMDAMNFEWGVKEKAEWVDARKDNLRFVLQRWGAEYRRTQDDSYWIDRLLERIAEDSPQVALVSDVRFANELAICHAAMKVEKIGQVEDPTVASHVSEREWRAHDFGPYVVRAAEGDLVALHSGAEEVFERIVREFRVQ